MINDGIDSVFEREALSYATLSDARHEPRARLRMRDVIALDTAFVAGWDRAELLARVQRIAGSVALDMAPDGRSFRVLGPAVPYHSHDPFLAAGLTRFHPD